MGLRTFLRQCVDVPVALGALAVIAIVWWRRARQAERERWPHAG